MGNVLDELRAFEGEMELRLNYAEKRAAKEIEQTRMSNQKRLDLERKRLEEEKEKLVLGVVEDAKKEARRIENEYKKRLEELKSDYKKNFDKAVDKGFGEIIK